MRAVDLDPANPRAHFGLAMTYARRREIVSSLASAERALALNPNDSIIAAGLGNTIAYSGDWERGLAVSLRAASLNPVRPTWQDVLLAAHDYQRGEYEEALAQLPKIRGGRGDEQVILHTAASYGQLGRASEARAALDSLLEIQPHYAEDARAELQRLYPSDAMVDRLLDGLRKAGLESGS